MNNDEIYDILPVELNNTFNSRELKRSNHHMIKKRNTLKKNDDILKIPMKNVKIEEFISKRSLNNQPVNLYVETLLVTDLTVYNDHSRWTGSTDQSVIFQSMKIYFAFIFNGVKLTHIILNHKLE